MDSSNPNTYAKSVLSRLTYRFKESSETPGLDAQVLLAHVLERTRTWVLAHPEIRLTPEQEVRLERFAGRLVSGEPLPYILGRWEFYGLEFEVSPDALIPRPETELLVDDALEWLRRHSGERLAADVGSGSGCIAVAIAVHHSQARVVAGDLSLPALRLAARNTARHAMQERVWCVQSDLLPAIGRHFDLICANLPYIPRETLAGLRVRRWEPVLALDGGVDGLDLVRRLLAQAAGSLAPEGLMLLEIEASQGDAASALAQSYFPGSEVSVVRDLAGRDRLIRIQAGPSDPL